ncbi:FixH family protein [Pseudofulvibacter geojedonensis]|uniref:FixH family protein n=1 Tax=Pseudofulvibacter geojedonensis TaxID=1123758 RepID=A0ABW3I1P4_9FLAO
MKINWGGGIVIAIVLFMAFILFFVVKMSTNSEYDHDLVTENYYKSELAFQEEIDKEKNLNMLLDPIGLELKADGVLISFPDELNPHKLNGKVFLYRPSNKNMDIEIPLKISSNILFLPKQDLVGGRWNLVIDFTHNDIPYLYKKELIL